MKRAPKDLQPATQKWVNYCMKSWNIDQHYERILILAAQAWDRCQQARGEIQKDGITIKDRYSAIKVHPAVAIERDSRLAFARLIRELQLDSEPPPEEARKPILYKNKIERG